MSQLHHVFFDEARENLDLVEQGLLRFAPQGDAQERRNGIFRALHSVKGGAAALGFADVASLAHLMESLLEQLRGGQTQSQSAMVDLLLESLDAMRNLLASHQGGAIATADTPHALVRRLQARVLGTEPSLAGRSLTVRVGPVDGVEDVNALVALFSDIPGLGEIVELPDESHGMRSFAVKTNSSDEELLALFAFHVARELVSIRSAGEEKSAVNSQPAIRSVDMDFSMVSMPPGAAPKQAEPHTIRVESSKVDQLVRLAEDFANTQSLLERSGRGSGSAANAQMLVALDELQRNMLDLKQAVRAIRTTSMAVVFNRFPRMLRQLARKLGKKFTLVINGEDTRLDQAMTERIVDPLMHLVRNSCDHGIEMPIERLAAGKPEAGTITLSAVMRNGAVAIEIRDDGRGLVREKVLKTARDRGLEVSDQMADAILWQLVFAPGFSTVDVVTEVSGRGVGMDVVKCNVAALRGTVEISSTPGLGTCVSISLPLADVGA